jgi:hypothetical protein
MVEPFSPARPLLVRALLAALLLIGAAASLAAQRSHEDYDDVDPWRGIDRRAPGPDSTALAGFLAVLARRMHSVSWRTRGR